MKIKKIILFILTPFCCFTTDSVYAGRTGQTRREAVQAKQVARAMACRKKTEQQRAVEKWVMRAVKHERRLAMQQHGVAEKAMREQQGIIASRLPLTRIGRPTIMNPVATTLLLAALCFQGFLPCTSSHLVCEPGQDKLARSEAQGLRLETRMVEVQERPVEGNYDAFVYRYKIPVTYGLAATDFQKFLALGSRERFGEKVQIGCSIGDNLTVTCCATEPVRCVAFDPTGIIGGPLATEGYEYHFDKEYHACTREHYEGEHRIRDEAVTFFMPRQLQNENGTECSTLNFESDPDKIDQIVHFSYSSRPPVVADVFLVKQVPSFFASVLRGLAKKIGLSTVPPIGLYSDAVGALWGGGRALVFRGERGGKLLEFIWLSYGFLKKYWDCEQKFVLAHELQHIRQKNGYTTNNNREAEADVAAVLAAGNACYAFDPEYVKFPSWALLPPPVFTRENLSEDLRIEDRYPRPLQRASLIIGMHKSYMLAREALLQTAEA